MILVILSWLHFWPIHIFSHFFNEFKNRSHITGNYSHKDAPCHQIGFPSPYFLSSIRATVGWVFKTSQLLIRDLHQTPKNPSVMKGSGVYLIIIMYQDSGCHTFWLSIQGNIRVLMRFYRLSWNSVSSGLAFSWEVMLLADFFTFFIFFFLCKEANLLDEAVYNGLNPFRSS